MAQVFTVGMEVAFEYQGTAFKLDVRNVTVKNQESLQQSVHTAMLVPSTACTFDAPPATGIQVHSHCGLSPLFSVHVGGW